MFAIELTIIELYIIFATIVFISLSIHIYFKTRSLERAYPPKVYNYNEKDLELLMKTIENKTSFIVKQNVIHLFQENIKKIDLSISITKEIIDVFSDNYLTIIYRYISKQHLKLYIQQIVLTKMEKILDQTTINVTHDKNMDIIVETFNNMGQAKNIKNKNKGP